VPGADRSCKRPASRPSSLHREHQPISIQAAALEQALFGASDDNNEESLQQEPESVQEPEPLEASEQQLAKDISRRNG